MNNNIKIPSTSVNTMLGCSGKQVTSNVITEEYIENYVSDKLENLRKKLNKFQIHQEHSQKKTQNKNKIKYQNGLVIPSTNIKTSFFIVFVHFL